MNVDWDDCYLVGIEEIDAHHKKLIEMINKSYTLILKENIQGELLQLLDELIEYAKYHFASEEKLMRKYRYHKIDMHMIEHFNFSNKVLTYRKESSGGKEYVSIDVFDFIMCHFSRAFTHLVFKPIHPGTAC